VIGWKSFLEGLIFDGDVLKIETEYYESFQRRSTELSWATKLSISMWNMIDSLWMQRNDQLRKTW